jgi:DNA replication protein DnaC
MECGYFLFRNINAILPKGGLSCPSWAPGRLLNLIEMNRALRQLRLGGMAAVLETRLQQAQVEAMAPIDLIACLISDELTRRSDRLLERRRKQAGFRDPQATLDNFDFDFNKKMNRSLVFQLATGNFIAKHDDGLFLGPPGTGKSHLVQARSSGDRNLTACERS